jgi:NTE family protein
MDSVQTEGSSERTRALVLSGGGGRGAFECGVIEKLTELGWRPDVLVGTSIGSMNAAVWAVGGTGRVSQMWDEIRTRHMHCLFRWPPYKSLFDRAPWKSTLENYAPEKQLQQVTTPLYIVTTDIKTGHPVVYTNYSDHNKPSYYQKVNAITHDHLLASSAIPYAYPKVGIKRKDEWVDHWDGAVMYNSPLRPAIDAGATEIFVVLLSPYHGPRASDAGLPPVPRGIVARIGYLLDLMILATFENDFEQMRKINRRVKQRSAAPDYKEINCALIGPDRWLTPLDIIRYWPKRIKRLRQLGQQAAEVTWKRVEQQDWDSLQG